MRPTWLFACVLAAAVPAQNADSKPADANAAKASPLERLRGAEEAARPKALAAFVDAQLATGAIFAGQYAALAELGWDPVPMLRMWLTEAPKDVAATPVMFREACIHALRDVVTEPSEALIEQLEKLAGDFLSPERLTSRAKYALYQFGKTEHVDKMLAAAKQQTEGAEVNTRLRGWTQLADIHYNVRDYAAAAAAHAKVIEIVEGLDPTWAGLPSSYYNCACSYALSGNKDEAMKRLARALELGKELDSPLEVSLLQSDMDIRSLRGEPAFAKLMKDYFGVEVGAAKQAAEEGTGGGKDGI